MKIILYTLLLLFFSGLFIISLIAFIQSFIEQYMNGLSEFEKRDIKARADAKKEKKEKKSFYFTVGFNCDHLLEGPRGFKAAVDKASKKIIFKDRVKPVKKIYGFSDIISSEVVIDGSHSVSKTNKTGSISGGIAGGLLFGPAGAFVGSRLAKTKNQDLVSNIDLILHINDIDAPIIRVRYLSMKAARDSFTFRSACSSARELHAHFQAIIHDAKTSPLNQQ